MALSNWKSTNVAMYQHKPCGWVARKEIVDMVGALRRQYNRSTSRTEMLPENFTSPSIDGYAIINGWMPALKCPNCQVDVLGKRVLGKDTGKVKQCNSKCMGAFGPTCDCPCMGENHGSSH